MGNYVSAADVCSMLRLDGTSAAVVADVENFIPIAEEMVDTYCRTTFVYTGAVDVEKTVNGNDNSYLPLNVYIASLTKVEVVNPITGDASGEILYCSIGPKSVYDRKGVGMFIENKVGATFPKGVENIKITGKFGFSTMPRPIKYATALIVKHLMNLSEHNFIHKEEEFFGKNTVHNAPVGIDSMPRVAMQALDPYRFTTNFDNAE